MRKKPALYEPTAILLKISDKISASLDFDKVCGLVLKECAKAMGVDYTSLFLVDDSGRHLFLEQAIGFSDNEIGNIKLLGSWETINTQLITRRKPLMINDVRKHPIFKRKQLPFSKELIPVSSFLAAPLRRGKQVIGALIAGNKKTSGRVFRKEDMRLMMALSNHVAIALLNAKLYQDTRELFISTVKSLVRAVDAKDPYTSGHSERVMRYSIALGKAMGLDGSRLENLGLSSLLHDVGKIGVREEILSKPVRLSEREKGEIKLHTAMGVNIVDTIRDSKKIILGIKEHHERFDGKGYPCRLKGQEISLEGRIIAVADAFDALTTDRPYRKAHSRREAFLEIRKGSSGQFDPAVVKSFTISFTREPQTWSGNNHVDTNGGGV